MSETEKAGGNWVDEACVVDGNIITSRKPDDIPAFNAEVIRLFSSVRRPSRQAAVT